MPEQPALETPVLEAPVLEAVDLVKTYRLPRAGAVLGQQGVLKAVNNVSLQLLAGKTAALVGQSGSGKSTLVRLLAQLERPTSGSIKIDGEPADARIGEHGLGRRYRAYCQQVQIVLQDPYASLNPGFRVGRCVRRPLEIHKLHGDRAGRDAEVRRLLEQVRLTPPEQYAAKFPHELSGGQRQRVAIARALAVGPKVLLADEPVSMLDVSVKIEILRVLNECRELFGLALLYVTHDIASARWCADTISVMYAGQIVESGPSEAITQQARHPYTQLLIRATPDPSAGPNSETPAQQETAPAGQPPAPSGCPFRLNCPKAMDKCAAQEPPVVQLADQQWVRCWLYDDAGSGA